jgi:hypothetical protein
MLVRIQNYIYKIIHNVDNYDFKINWRKGTCYLRISSNFVCTSNPLSTNALNFLLDHLTKYLNNELERFNEDQIKEFGNEQLLLCLKMKELEEHLNRLKEEGKKFKIYGGLALIYSDLFNDISCIYNNAEKVKALIKNGSAIKGIDLNDNLRKFFNIHDYEKKWKLHYSIKYHKPISTYKNDITVLAIRESNINNLIKKLDVS